MCRGNGRCACSNGGKHTHTHGTRGGACVVGRSVAETELRGARPHGVAARGAPYRRVATCVAIGRGARGLNDRCAPLCPAQGRCDVGDCGQMSCRQVGKAGNVGGGMREHQTRRTAHRRNIFSARSGRGDIERPADANHSAYRRAVAYNRKPPPLNMPLYCPLGLMSPTTDTILQRRCSTLHD